MNLSGKFLLILLFVSLVYTGCKEKQLPDMPERQRAYLHFVNLNPDYPGVDCNVEAFDSKGQFFSNLQYLQTWPLKGYASLLTLQDEDASNQIQDTSWIYFNLRNFVTGDTIIPHQKFSLSNENNSSNTMILLREDTKPLLVKTMDNFDEYTDTTANVRFMNFHPLMTSASLVSSDSSQTVKITNLGYKIYTPFKAFKKGRYNLKIINDQLPATIDSFMNFELKMKRNYSFYLFQDGSGQARVIMEEMNK